MSYITTNHISLDIYNNSIVCINAKQFDANARFIEITCTENGKKIILIKDEVKAYLGCTKPDGKYVLNECEILENGLVQIELTQQILAKNGKCKMDLMLIDASGDININKKNELVLLNTSILSTMCFYVNVLPASIDNATVESSSEYNGLLNAISRNIALEKELQENENGIINEYGTVIQDGRVQTEEKRVIAEEKRVAAEIVREQQETKRIETFNTNETNRQSTFETNEKYREKTFSDNETERSNTFTTNENERTTTFTENETNRQSDFDSNEVDRQTTFDTSEETRTNEFNNKETKRQNTFDTNETDRQNTFTSNEDSRTSLFNTNISTWNEKVTEVIQKSENAELARSESFTNSLAEWNQEISETIQNCNSSIDSKVQEFTTKVDTLTSDCNTAETKRAEAEISRANAETNREKLFSEKITECGSATERANTAAQTCEDIASSGIVTDNDKGVAGGIATLDENLKIPNEQINTDFVVKDNNRTVISSGDSLDSILSMLSIYMSTVDKMIERMGNIIDVSDL